ncbi:PTS lactose transporter subunit IIB [Erwinia sp. E602]|mgnify:CR=1 FL=1|uniref:PTS sugar transporter subunit IIB n=1 Tax=unclassified Erwinia TaxID=2622719 RepID=UPI0006F94159|nr:MULTISPECIES: PTS sugar transporter subunit IIB [unclassified Erwinia]KQN57858.1 PTS lactose transporter subunit IIB [Erwinia sp. Leaf53]PLV59604.1 PTS lactose transporter subunit IIB [Erwinia sp. B116]QUG77396.1 PTS lactose transporter subunit IIB [Erwinia sp. E602]
MLKVLCVCGCGLGSSFAIEMSAKSVLQKLSIDADIDHTTVSEASSFKYDIILTQKMFADILNSDASEEDKRKVIILNRLTDKKEIEEKILAYINAK